MTLFELLRMALWGTDGAAAGHGDATAMAPHSAAADTTDWPALLRQAERQTVLGLVADAVGMLPEAQRPPLALRMKLIAMVRRTEQAYRFQAATLDEMATALAALGVRPVLMKGLSVAARYPVPEHRAVGDIDLFFTSSADLARANDWARTHGTDIENFYAKHLTFKYKGVPVENHSRLCDFRSKRYNLRCAKIFAAPPRGFFCDAPEIFSRRPAVFELPPTQYAFFLLCHKAEHIIEDGLGLRHVCDWAVFLDRESGNIDREQFWQWVCALDMQRMAHAFGRICVDHLGLSEAKLPFTLRRDDDTSYRLLLDQIMSGGNFGKQFYKYKGRVSKLEDMWRTLWIKLPRYARVLRLWPREALNCYAALLVRGCRRLKK